MTIRAGNTTAKRTAVATSQPTLAGGPLCALRSWPQGSGWTKPFTSSVNRLSVAFFHFQPVRRAPCHSHPAGTCPAGQVSQRSGQCQGARQGQKQARKPTCPVLHLSRDTSQVIALIVGKLQWEEHMEQVQAMQSCNLSHSDVFSCGDSSWLRQRLVNLNELILSSVLITTWSTVAAIISALPTLETLDVSNNLLQLTDADRDERQPVLSASLAQIILNATVSAIVRLMWHTSCNALWQGMSWPDAQFLPAAFPRLQRLHLSRNSISSLSLASGSVQRWFGLQLLIVENNVIESWSDVAHLAPLPSLVRLSLCGNPVAGAHVPTPLCT
jgi:Leucine-rich repeat (LRR) protein